MLYLLLCECLCLCLTNSRAFLLLFQAWRHEEHTLVAAVASARTFSPPRIPDPHHRRRNAQASLPAAPHPTRAAIASSTCTCSGVTPARGARKHRARDRDAQRSMQEEEEEEEEEEEGRDEYRAAFAALLVDMDEEERC
jgi:hypothetical protein